MKIYRKNKFNVERFMCYLWSSAIACAWGMGFHQGKDADYYFKVVFIVFIMASPLFIIRHVIYRKNGKAPDIELTPKLLLVKSITNNVFRYKAEFICQIEDDNNRVKLTIIETDVPLKKHTLCIKKSEYSRDDLDKIVKVISDWVSQNSGVRQQRAA